MGKAPSIILPSLQLPGLLCLTGCFFNLIFPNNLSSARARLGATLIVESSSLATETGGVEWISSHSYININA